LVNNAAIPGPGGIATATELSQIVDAEALEDINVEVIVYLRTARAFATHLIQNGWGRIINIGALAIHRPSRPERPLRVAPK